jgi:biopolymer transport protein ExbB/TolQ
VLLVLSWLHPLVHWLQWGSVPAWVAAGISIWQARQARKASRRSKKAELEAKQHAENALAAQQQIAEETKRLAGSIERQTHLGEQEAAAAEHAPWQIEQRKRGLSVAYYLVNKLTRRSTTSAFPGLYGSMA